MTRSSRHASIRNTVSIGILASVAVACGRSPQENTPLRERGLSEQPADAPAGITPPAPRPLPSPDRISVTDSVSSGLAWLRRQQADGGRWDDPATTGIVLLAFSGFGQTHQSGTYHQVVKDGLLFLRNVQDADGCLVARDAPHRLRDHAIAGLALIEVYGMTGSLVLKEPAKHAVAFALKARARRGAWNLPEPHADETDVEATGWMSLMVRSAVLAELDVDAAMTSEAREAFDRITDATTGRVRVSPHETPPLSEDAATAIGVLVRKWSGHLDDDPVIPKAADSLVSRLPASATTDLPSAYFGTIAMMSLGRDHWRAWNPGMHDGFLKGQRTEGDDAGSWEPIADARGESRIWSTAVHLLCSEVYFGPSAHVRR